MERANKAIFEDLRQAHIEWERARDKLIEFRDQFVSRGIIEPGQDIGWFERSLAEHRLKGLLEEAERQEKDAFNRYQDSLTRWMQQLRASPPRTLHTLMAGRST